MIKKQTVNQQPYISFVTAVRNDEYADPGYKKLKLNLKFLSEQCAEYGLPAENILVEWNPDLSKESIRDVLAGLDLSGELTVRVITVPSHFHKKWKYSHLRPMHPSVAINVGLRRARGQFCTLKTQDTFYDDALIEFLSNQDLEKNKLYRAVRLDTSPDLLDKPFVNREEFLNLCRSSIIVRNEPVPLPKCALFSLPQLFTNACGDFQVMSKEHFFQMRGYPETRDIRAYATDSLLSFTAHAHKIQEVVLAPPHAVYKVSHFQLNQYRYERPSEASVPLYDKFFLELESRWPFSLSPFLMRALFNYPQKFYHGKPIDCYERSLLVFKLLSRFSWMTRFKTSKWGYGNKRFQETLLYAAKWEREQPL